MRYGIFSDIHANLEAFAAVLEALAAENIDQYICGGDIVGYGADPSRCIALVNKLNPLIVCGNHDHAACGMLDMSYFNPYARDAALWTQEKLSEEEKAFLGSLQYVHEDRAYTMVHGSLDSPKSFCYILNGEDAYKTIDRMKGALCFVGHTHVPGVFRLDEHKLSYSEKGSISIEPGMKYVVNVGSVGQPRDGDKRAAYACYDDETQTVEIKRVPYDIKKAQRKIIGAKLPLVLAERLSAGK